MSGSDRDSSQPSGRWSLKVLVTGTVFAQGIQFAASLILTRLYAPTEFGEYAAMLSFATVLGTVIAFSYPSAVPLAETDEEGRCLTWLGIVLAFVMTLASTLVLGALVVWDISILGLNPGWPFVLFVPATALAIATWMSLQRWQSRLHGFGKMSRGTATGASVQVAVQTTTGWLGSNSAGLSAGYLAGRLTNLALLWRGSHLGVPPGLRSLLDLARVWSDMPRWLLFPVVMNLLGTSAITPWVVHNYGLSTAGSFAFALQMLSAPAALVGQAVATILFPRFALAERRLGVTAGEMERYVVGLASIAYPMFLPVLVLGPELFSVAFGASWEHAGVVAAILTPWIAANFVSSPLSSYAVVKGRYRRVALIASVETAVRFLAISLGSVLGSEVAGFALYSVAGVAICTVSVSWMLRLAGGGPSHLVKTNHRVIVVSILAAAILLAARLFLPVTLVCALTALVVFAAVVPVIRNVRGSN